jgi:osmotically-inducible protein OsmY
MRLINLLLLTALLALQGCSGFPTSIGGGSGDLRSAGTQLEDDTIETKSMTRIEEKYKDTVQVVVTSFNRFVLITGSTLNEETKTDIERIVRTVPNVKKTANEILIGALPTFSERRADSQVVSSFKYHLGKNKAFQTTTIKAVSNHGVVYLLGLVTHEQANIAANVASATPGAVKVVKVFEYID